MKNVKRSGLCDDVMKRRRETPNFDGGQVVGSDGF